MSDPIKPKPWDLVRLEGYTDIYRTYTNGSGLVFVGQNSDTVKTEYDVVVSEVIKTEAQG